jgi:multiple sugar transport system substrate-binding protein
MMIRFRPHFLVVLGATAALVLGGCVGSDDSAEDGGGSTGGAAGGGTESGDAAAGGDALEMWTFKQSHVEALESAAAAFEEETGVAVDVQAITPDDVFAQRIQAGAQTGDLPDVLEVHAAGEDYTLGAAGLLADLSEDFGDRSQFLPTVADAGLVTSAVFERSQEAESPYAGVEEGQLFSVPFTSGTFGIVYANKATLEAAGLDPETPPATWEEFVSALEATTAADPEAGGLMLGLGVSQTGHNWVLEPTAYALLGEERFEALYGEDPAASFASPDGLRVLETYDQLTSYWSPEAPSLGIDEADIAFVNGEAAMLVGGTFTLAFLEANGLAAEDVLAFPLPAPADGEAPGRGLGPIALSGLSVAADSDNPEAAREWIEFLSRPEQAGAFAQTALDLPAVDLGSDAESLLGPQLTALQAVLTSEEGNTWDPLDTSHRPAAWDEGQVGDTLLRMSPLDELDPAATGQALDQLMASFRG